jgi:hypothetical protein
MAFSRERLLFASHVCDVFQRTLYRRDVVTKASSLASSFELKTSLGPISKCHRRMTKRLERNMVNYTKEEIVIDNGF